jgi:hypothetical protein
VFGAGVDRLPPTGPVLPPPVCRGQVTAASQPTGVVAVDPLEALAVFAGESVAVQADDGKVVGRARAAKAVWVVACWDASLLWGWCAMIAGAS